MSTENLSSTQRTVEDIQADLDRYVENGGELMPLNFILSASDMDIWVTGRQELHRASVSEWVASQPFSENCS